MIPRPLRVITLACSVAALSACEKPADAAAENASERPSSKRPTENYSPEEKAAAAKLVKARDPIDEQITAFHAPIREAFLDRRFDELEKTAAELRAGKEVFGNGSWKIVQFYAALEARERKDPEQKWQAHEQIYRDWIAAKPDSITAKIAYADFLTDYAWKARGGGYADTVTEEGARLMDERLTAALEQLKAARKQPERDPVWGTVALTVALGQSWPKPAYDALLSELTAREPKFWGYHTTRAYSLLPRWYGEEGEWEKYAEEVAARPDGLGAEVYARIVYNQNRYYDNVFRETKASWPLAKKGFEEMRKKYPDSLEILSRSAMLATVAQDRATAKQLFDELGDRYLPDVWRRPERMVHYRHWAETGKW